MDYFGQIFVVIFQYFRENVTFQLSPHLEIST